MDITCKMANHYHVRDYLDKEDTLYNCVYTYTALVPTLTVTKSQCEATRRTLTRFP